MGATFNDITLYAPTPYKNGTPEYWEDTSLINFVCDLYVQKMYGYKPPQATRVTLQPAFYNVWNRTWKNGSLFSIAPLFERDKYEAFDKAEKYRYILDIVHGSMVQLGGEYKWNTAVFESAYHEIINGDFTFIIEFDFKTSSDKKKKGRLVIEKTETASTAYAVIHSETNIVKAKLFEKRNWHSSDSIYEIAKHYKWIDKDRFGISIKALRFAVWYSLTDDNVLFEVKGEIIEDYDLKRMFTL
jgi:hypothetical protein